MAKRGGFPGGRNAGKYGKFNEAGSEDAEADGRAGKRDGREKFYSNCRRRSCRSDLSGKKEVQKVKLQEEVVDPDDVEMLEDLIMAAVNEALRQVDEANTSAMSKLTGGLGGMPGMF